MTDGTLDVLYNAGGDLDLALFSLVELRENGNGDAEIKKVEDMLYDASKALSHIIKARESKEEVE